MAQMLLEVEFETPREFRKVAETLVMVEYYRPWLFQPAAAQDIGAQII